MTAGFDAAGKEYERRDYDNAPHSFFDASYAEWREECADALAPHPRLHPAARRGGGFREPG